MILATVFDDNNYGVAIISCVVNISTPASQMLKLAQGCETVFSNFSLKHL